MQCIRILSCVETKENSLINTMWAWFVLGKQNVQANRSILILLQYE